MTRILKNLITCCFLTCLFSSWVIAVNDFTDGTHDEAWFILNGGSTYDLKVLEPGDEYQEHEVYYITVNASYIAGHATNKTGTTHYPHAHFCDDYDNIDYDEEGDDYWDYMFKEGSETDRVSGTHCTNKRNCYAYALDEVIGLGSYSCWLNSSQAKLAIAVDADSTAKANVAADNVLWYAHVIGPITQHKHATGVITIDSVANKPNKLRWKYATSGIYEIERTTFETPMCDDTTTTEGQPMGGNWDWDAAGDESDLWPSSSVWQPDP
jgi:hypothetical protein